MTRFNELLFVIQSAIMAIPTIDIAPPATIFEGIFGSSAVLTCHHITTTATISTRTKTYAGTMSFQSIPYYSMS